jgi:peptidoglycan-associated lipoprotein
MRALMMLALIPLVTACSTAAPMWRGENAGTDISGRWTGTWIGTGLFNSPRQDDVTVDLVQSGHVGHGRLIIEGTTAAESVPEEIRLQGLGGVRIFADISGRKVRLTHELSSRLFTADLTLVDENRMVGDVRGSVPGVRLVLSRGGPSVAPQAAQAMPPVAREPVPPPAPGVIVVLTPPPPEPAEESQVAAPRPRQEEFVEVPELKRVYFAFDKSALAPEAIDVLTSNASWLKENDDTLVLIEGYCDERGTAEYNLALGDRRAKSVMDYLAASGISRDRVSTISYGKERPICRENTAECMRESRRAEFRIKSR